jgi:hypothetical protein
MIYLVHLQLRKFLLFGYTSELIYIGGVLI